MFFNRTITSRAGDFFNRIRPPVIRRDKRIIALFVLFFCGCAAVTPSFMRAFIIELAERFVVHRKLTAPVWMEFLLQASIKSVALSVPALLGYLFIDLKKGLEKQPAADFYRRAFIKPVSGMFVLYALGMTSIIRADFLYGYDDILRALSIRGREWDFSRHVTNSLAVILHADTRPADISPLPQLLAALFLAAAGVLLVYAVSGGRITKTACFVSLSAGLSPLFLECLAFKFDAPYMALSILVSVVPFLFVRDFVVFSFVSFVSLLVMTMTYQSSSGIYIIVVIVLCLKAWNERSETGKRILCFAGVSALSYSLALVYFRVFFMESFTRQNITTDVFSAGRLFSGVLDNAVVYMRTVNNDYALVWKILTILVCVMFLVKTAVSTKRNKAAALAVSLAALTAMCVLSCGVYLVLSGMNFYRPRYLYGFGVFIAIAGIHAVHGEGVIGKITAVPAVLLSWCFVVFSFLYGNMLSDQRKYSDFRAGILVHDLSVLFPQRTGEKIKIEGGEGLAPSIQNRVARYPILPKLIMTRIVPSYSVHYLKGYYNFDLQDDEQIEDAGLDTMLDSYYHTIKSDGNRIVVILK
ncbi:MAG: glucosyltransferase domain-containing protein [Spirochaetaceae bacterium]|jgi:hypothetical protein|nr:glucosyltransferase domain-containing protein [Spirochaetaceae bacterium]